MFELLDQNSEATVKPLPHTGSNHLIYYSGVMWPNSELKPNTVRKKTERSEYVLCRGNGWCVLGEFLLLFYN